jgi:hypothetical protein
MRFDESGLIRTRNLVTCLVLLALPGIVSSQGKIYGTLACEPAAEQRSTTASDKFGSAAATLGSNCTWPEPLVIAGLSAKDAQNTGQSGVKAAENQATVYVVHMANGDQVTLRFSPVGPLNSSRRLEGTWTFADGTGILKEITGHGTYTGLPRAAGGTSYDIEGTSDPPAADVPPRAETTAGAKQNPLPD